jgi:hypothetical protein
MHIQRSPWPTPRVERRRATWPLRKDFVAVLVVCTIFGLQILAVMLCTGGPDAYNLVASEGMQFE